MQIVASFLNRESLTAAGIFAFTLLCFLLSHIHQVADSEYSMLLSESLLHHRSFTLERYSIPRNEPTWHGYYFKNGPIYQLEVAGGHIYYHMPPGSSILSIPFVAVLNTLGISAVKSDGSYDNRGEVIIESGLAALLMALLAAVFFYTARLMLPLGWSVLVALGGALGTQVYSTASRALWSDTWGILLLGFVIFLLLGHETGRRRLSPVLFASLLSWMYFVRPTFAVHIFAISVYVFIFYRQLFLRYALTGAVWLALFILYSWRHFHQLLPSYYRASRLQFSSFWTALAGNLVSPARGVLVYVPVLLFVFFLLARYRRYLAHVRLVWLSLTIIAGHLIAVSGFSHWWGGHSFGPRMTTGLVPWFVLLGILGLAAMLAWRREHEHGLTISHADWRTQLTVGSALLMLSVFINTLGATSHATWLWNMRPYEIDKHPERLWDWRQPQFLAGYLPFPPPREFPLMGTTRIEFSTPEAEKYLWYGWSEDQSGYWSDNRSALVFTVGEVRSYVLRLNMAPFVVPGKLETQRVKFVLNGQPLSMLTLTDSAVQTYSIQLPGYFLRAKNILGLEIPNAQSQQKLGTGEDPRLRGINLQWIELEPEQQ
jgi:hypothetical protein